MQSLVNGPNPDQESLSRSANVQIQEMKKELQDFGARLQALADRTQAKDKGGIDDGEKEENESLQTKVPAHSDKRSSPASEDRREDKRCRS